MSDKIEAKPVPLQKIHVCLSVLERQQKCVKMFKKLYKEKHLTQEDIESKILRPLILISDAIKNMFMESNSLEEDHQLTNDNLSSLIKTFIQLPRIFITSYKNNKMELPHIIPSILPEIEKSCRTKLA